MNRPVILLAIAAAFTAAACEDAVVRPDDPQPAGRPVADVVATADGGPRYSARVLDVEAALDPDIRITVGGYLNNRGQVTARLLRATGTRQFVSAGVLIWDTEAGTVEQVDFGDVIFGPFINDAGQLAGTMDSDPGAFTGREPFLWTPGAGVQPLGFSGNALGLNDRGQVVGSRITGSQPDLDFQAFLWDPVAGLKLLDEPPGARESRARDINNVGVAVGVAVFGSLDAGQAMLWDPALGATVLPVGPGSAGAGAVGISELGRIVGGLVDIGEFGFPRFQSNAFWPSRDAQPILLPCELPAFEDCAPIAINDHGVILGSYGGDEAEIPMIWFEGQTYDLNALVLEGPSITFALDMNDRGQIGGYTGVRFDPVLGTVQTLVILTPISDTRVVRIDVKPGSDPNSFNLNGKGVLPVAVLGDADLDPADLDPETLRLNGFVVGRRGNGDPQCGVEDVDDDGFDDLVCQFIDDLSRWTGPDDVAVLTGELRDGTAIEGTDSLRLVPPQ